MGGEPVSAAVSGDAGAWIAYNDVSIPRYQGGEIIT
ncbi:MAG: hypothetical protein METHAR1v1_310024 [Methanothrix sp.]|nr:MAG: hypothetical protein METHAR1v1_310024 [Methanothrix sp.]